jgi:predicted CoA-binding protein
MPDAERATEPYTPGDPELRSILGQARTIAMIGLSSTPDRYSFEVASYPSPLEVPSEIRIDAMDVFRRAEETPEVARQAVAVGARVLWLQNDIVNDEARRIAEEGGLEVVMGVCMMSTHRRLSRRG